LRPGAPQPDIRVVNLRRFSTLHIALAVSIAVHAALLTLRIVDPERFNRWFESGPLDVILVNTSSSQVPDKAQAIAQTSLDGGGQAEAGRSTSPLPMAVESIDSFEAGTQEQQLLRHMQARQSELLAQIKALLATPRPSEARDALNTPEQAEELRKRQQLIKLLAEIERRIETDSRKPRKRYISPATREAPYALYYDRMRRAIEEQGTQDFPQARGQKLYGSLIMIVNVNQQGRVLSTEVVQSSGNRDLDRRAQAIAQQAGPFGAFSKAMRQSADVIAVVSRFNFSHDDTLTTQASVREEGRP
jgi:protein TonB